MRRTRYSGCSFAAWFIFIFFGEYLAVVLHVFIFKAVATPCVQRWELRHNDTHQAVLVMRAYEWTPVVFDGLRLNEESCQSILDAAEAMCALLEDQLFGQVTDPLQRTPALECFCGGSAKNC